jgi:hypothetical protein
VHTLTSPDDNEALLKRDPEAVDQLIARVLSGAHRTEALGAPNEARAILHVAHSFADELAALDPDSTVCSS